MRLRNTDSGAAATRAAVLAVALVALSVPASFTAQAFQAAPLSSADSQARIAAVEPSAREASAAAREPVSDLPETGAAATEPAAALPESTAPTPESLAAAPQPATAGSEVTPPPPGAAWTLAAAVARAVEDGPDVKAAEYMAAAAGARVDQASAAFQPRLQLRSGYTQTDNPVAAFSYILNQGKFAPDLDVNNPEATDNLNVGGLLSYSVFAGGRDSAGREGALAGAEAARLYVSALRNSIAFEVARAFYSIVEAKGLVAASESAVASMEANLAIARRRVEAGTILKSERLDVEVRLAQAREERAAARNGLASAQQRLAELLGLEDGAAIRVADQAPELPAPDIDDFSARPELAAAEREIEAAEAAQRVAASGRLPSVDAFGSYDFDRGWEYHGSGSSWTVGVAMNWNIWDGKLTSAREAEAMAALSAAREKARGLRLAIAREVVQARSDLDTAVERLNVSEKAVEQAEESADLMRARFSEGLALSVQLLDAETQLTAARVRRTRAEVARNVATAALRRALGMQITGAGGA